MRGVAASLCALTEQIIFTYSSLINYFITFMFLFKFWQKTAIDRENTLSHEYNKLDICVLDTLHGMKC